MSAAPVVDGIEFLMNQSKKRAAGSASDSGSVTSALSASRAVSRAATPPAAPSSGQMQAQVHPAFQQMFSQAPSDVTVPRPPSPSFRHPPAPSLFSAAPSAPAPPFFFGRRAQEDDDDEDDDDEDEDDDEEEDEEEDEDDDDDSDESSAIQRADDRMRRQLSPEETIHAKRDVLYKLDRIEKKGVCIPRHFTMADSLDEMRAELERVTLNREIDISVRWQRQTLMTCITGIELLNKKFDPFAVNLTGWSDQMHEQINDYDDVFEELHMKYRGKSKMAPELRLLLGIGGSAVMFHMTQSMFRNTNIPGVEQVMRENPGLAREFTEAAMRSQQRQQQPQGGGGGGGMLGGLLNMFGGGVGNRQAQAPPAAPPGKPAMRGPKPVDEYLKDLHRNAFPQGDDRYGNSRIEIVSNVSDTDIGDLPDETASVFGEAAPPPPAKNRRRK